jgi:hypothetical protein
MTNKLNESTIEDAALTWFGELGYTVLRGLDIAPGELMAERSAYGETVLFRRLRDALVRLNPHLPPEALADALRKFTIPPRALARCEQPGVSAGVGNNAVRSKLEKQQPGTLATLRVALLPKLLSGELLVLAK